MPLEDVLARIPGFAGWEAVKQRNAQTDAQQIQQAGALQTIFAHQQAAQKEQAFRSELTALGANPSQEALAALGAKYAGAKELLTSQTSSLDRKAAIESAALNRDTARLQAESMQKERLAAAANIAQQRSQDQMISQADRNQARMDMIRLTASLKAAPADKTPMGYRKTADNNLEAIPGGPADLKQQGVLNQDTAALGSMNSDMDRLAAEANRLKEHPGLSKTTGAMGWVPGVGGFATIPGTDAANFKAGLETLKSQVAFGVLQNMRNNSKTGGALGQVSDAEGKLLAANLAAIDRAQSPAEFKAALGRIITYTEGAKDRLRAAYNLKHGDKPAAGGIPEFATESAAAAAGLQPGTKVKIGGVLGTWR